MDYSKMTLNQAKRLEMESQVCYWARKHALIRIVHCMQQCILLTKFLTKCASFTIAGIVKRIACDGSPKLVGTCTRAGEGVADGENSPYWVEEDPLPPGGCCRGLGWSEYKPLLNIVIITFYFVFISIFFLFQEDSWDLALLHAVMSDNYHNTLYPVWA